jgi:hypothetical protein
VSAFGYMFPEMKRVLKLLVLGYVAAGIVGLYRERVGAIECECSDDCWCKRPGLSLFRWVFPVGHKLG